MFATNGVVAAAFVTLLLALPHSARAADECGTGPVVTCSGNYSTGVSYTVSSDLMVNVPAPPATVPSFGSTGMTLTGTGNAGLTLNVFNRTNGVGAITLITDTGNITANLTHPAGVAFSTLGGPLRIVTNGTAVVNYTGDVNANGVTSNAITLLDLSPGASGTVTFNNAGKLTGNSSDESAGVVLQGSGAGAVTLNNNGLMRGRIDLSGASGSLTLVNNTGHPTKGGWVLSGVSTLGSGDDRIVNNARGVIKTFETAAQPDTSIDFGAGDDTFVNAGRLIVDRQDTQQTWRRRGTMTLLNLEHFENSGTILLGAAYYSPEQKAEISNGAPVNRLTAHGVAFNGLPGSRIALDAILSGTSQPDCSELTAADCVDFTGGSTAGMTTLLVTDTQPTLGAAAFNPGIVLIEGSTGEHFTVDPASLHYVAHTSGGPAIQKGLVTYRLVYDGDARQTKLVGVLADEGEQGATFGASAQEIWRATADTWFDRQADLHTAPGAHDAGLWTALNMRSGERDHSATFAEGGSRYGYNVDHRQDISHLAVGADLIRGGDADTAWSLGATLGYAYSTIDYDATQLKSEIGGFATGVYASYLSGPLTVDGMFNVNVLTLDLDAHNLGLGPKTQVSTHLTSIGGRVEAGWRVAMNESFWLQPLAGASYVSTRFDDMNLPEDGGGLQFDDDKSLRLGLGLRTGLDSRLFGVKASYSVTGRWWNDLEGKNDTTATIGDGTQTALRDDFGGSFGELAAGVKVSSDSGALSGYLDLGGKFASDYSSLGGSAGFRYQW